MTGTRIEHPSARRAREETEAQAYHAQRQANRLRLTGTPATRDELRAAVLNLVDVKDRFVHAGTDAIQTLDGICHRPEASWVNRPSATSPFPV